MHIVVRETNVTTNLSPDSRRRFIPHHILESMRSKAGGLIATNLSLASGCFLYDYLGPPQTRVKKQETRNKKQNGLAHLRLLVCVTPK